MKLPGCAALVLWLLPTLAAADQVTVLPLVATSDPAEASAAQTLAAELAQRCPGAGQIAYDDLVRLSPTASAAGPEPPSAPSPRALFLNGDGEDGPGTALRLLQLVSTLSQDPAALLASPARRRQLREAYLFSARSLLHSGDRPGAQRLLRSAALRFPDQPPLSAAEWGPALHAADQEIRQALPHAQHPLAVEGPAGWAVHIDEQPVGALPSFSALLPPGPHAVVVVARDGTRWSWTLELPLPAGRAARLCAGPRSPSLCAIPGAAASVAGLCAPDVRPPAAWPQLAFSLGGDVLLVTALPASEVRGWRLHPGAPAPEPVRAAGAGALSSLVDRLCPGGRRPPSPQPAAALVPAAPPVAAPAALLQRERQVRASRRRWPAALLLGAGLSLAAAGVPLLALQGRCVTSECVRVYDFGWLAPTLLGVGAAATLGGGLWLGFSVR